jgi:tetratricopeptide (TPR) repeat protein
MKSSLVCLLAIGIVLAGIPSPSRALTADEAYQNGTALYKNGQWKESINQFQEAVQLDPNHWQAYQAMGYAYIQDGNPHAALNACTISLRINPNNTALQDYMNIRFNSGGIPAAKKPTDAGSTGAVLASLGASLVVLIGSLIGNVHFSGGSC